MLFFHLHLGLPSYLFLSDFLSKYFCAFLSYPLLAFCPLYVILFHPFEFTTHKHDWNSVCARGILMSEFLSVISCCVMRPLRNVSVWSEEGHPRNVSAEIRYSNEIPSECSSSVLLLK
jgi:hypothetical protein